MLAATENKLRWFGIDMRPRWRRRVAVVGTYLVFIPITGMVMVDSWTPHPYLSFLGMLVASTVWICISVFRPNGVVKSFEDMPPAMQKVIRLNGLDDWARHLYGVESFDAASPEQQNDVLNRFRFGTYTVKPKPELVQKLDEREQKERDTAARWSLKALGGYLGIAAGMKMAHIARHRPDDPRETVADFCLLGLLAGTLPIARILWTEPDPREYSGELEMLPGVEA